jgi:hypothetical protein
MAGRDTAHGAYLEPAGGVVFLSAVIRSSEGRKGR